MHHYSSAGRHKEDVITSYSIHYTKLYELAKLVQSPTEVTKEQHLVGSAAFLSPEQILHSTATAASDIYALGVLFYLMP